MIGRNTSSAIILRGVMALCFLLLGILALPESPAWGAVVIAISLIILAILYWGVKSDTKKSKDQ